MQRSHCIPKIRSRWHPQEGAGPAGSARVDRSAWVDPTALAGVENRFSLALQPLELKDFNTEFGVDGFPMPGAGSGVGRAARDPRQRELSNPVSTKSPILVTAGNGAEGYFIHFKEDSNSAGIRVGAGRIDGIGERAFQIQDSRGQAAVTKGPPQIPNSGACATLIKGVLLVAFLLSLPVTSLKAARHPALDPNVDAAKCIKCHADKTGAKSAQRQRLDCLSCHEVRVNKDITRVKLITPTPARLCFTCHKDKNPATLTGRIHPPDARDCLKCHDPHKSENPALLLKPMSGGAEDKPLPRLP